MTSSHATRPSGDVTAILTNVDDRYWFDNSLSDEGNRLRLLEAIADPRSIRLLSDLDIEQGWQCAELGAGGGSIAMWLADQVGDRGSVMAVDRDVTLLGHLNERSNIDIVEAPIESLRLPPASLDLIHTRNVLMHINEADDIIARLVEALRVGGNPPPGGGGLFSTRRHDFSGRLRSRQCIGGRVDLGPYDPHDHLPAAGL